MKIGLIGNTFRRIHKEGLVTGFQIATNDLMDAFLIHSDAEEIVCLYEPRQYQESQLMQYIGNTETRTRIRMVSEYDLLFHGSDAMPAVDVLYSVKEDALALLSLRETMCPRVPITFVFHGIAEQHLVLDMFYPMLFYPFKPYDAVICTSDAVRQTVERILKRMEEMHPALGPAKIRLETVPLGVDTSYFAPMDRNTARAKYGISSQAFVILWFGRFSDTFKADLYPLLLVFKQLLQQNPAKELMLVLAGSCAAGEYYDRDILADIERMQMTEHVRLLYNNDIDNRAELYSAADVFTSPVDNIQETFGLTPVEAMACGVPQVVSDWDGYKDTVADGVTGFRIPTYWADCLDDMAADDCLPLDLSRRRLLYRHLTVRSVVVDCTVYAEKIQYLLDHPSVQQEMGKASRKRAVEHYDLKITVKETEKVWKKLCLLAEQYEPEEREPRLPMLDYCGDFRAYPTRYVEDSTFFMVTEFGKNAQGEDLRQNEMFASAIEEAGLPPQLLEYARKTDRFTIVMLSEAFPQYTAPQIKRSVMFLFKYAMIQAEFGPESAPAQ